MQNTIRVLVVLLPVLCWPLVGSAADSNGQMSTEQMEQKLSTVEEQVKQQKEELQQQRDKAAQLEKQVNCNYTLLNGYKACENKFDKTTQEYLDCSLKAKKDYEQCLSAIASK